MSIEVVGVALRPEQGACRMARHSSPFPMFFHSGEKYTMKHLSLVTAIAGAAFSLLAMAPAHAAVDVDAAKALAKKNDCFKCHAPDKSKKGPSLKKISDKYRGKADGQEKAIKNMTTGPKVKLEDGKEEEHKVIDTKDMAQLKNLADWILSH
jgi:cytochrome c